MPPSRPALASGTNGLSPQRQRRSHWSLLTVCLAGVLLQYVWRVQEMYPQLRFIQFTALVSVGAMAMFVLDGRAMHRLLPPKDRMFRLILGIFVLAVLTIPTSLHPGASFGFLRSNFVKTVVLAGVLGASIRDREDVDRLLRIFVLGGVIYIASAIAFAPPGSGRLGGGSYDPNDLGLFTISTIPFAVYLLRRGAPIGDRILGLTAAVLLVAATVLSGSRGGFLAFITVAVYGLLMLDAVRLSKRLTVMVVAGGLMVSLAGDSYWDRMRTILTPQEDYNWDAESGRMEVWKRGIGYMLRRPALGVGVDQFNLAEGSLSPLAARQELGIGVRWSAAHNSYIQIGAELGVLGLVGFAALLAVAFLEARRIGRFAITKADRFLGQAFGGLVAGYAVGCAFISQAYGTYLYFAIGLLIGFSRVVGRVDRAAVAPTVVGSAAVLRQSRGLGAAARVGAR